MEQEHPDNIVGICSDCGDERKKKWQDENKKTKIKVGNYVKLLFKDADGGEHMWVKVTKLSKKNFEGTLDNIPSAVANINFGEKVIFTRDKIEDLMV